MAKIESSQYAEWTKHDFKIAIKKFWKWLKNCEEGYPPEVRWVKATLKHHQKKLPDEILTPAEIQRLIGSARTVRDKALISVLYESGCRIGELMGLKIKHVQFNDHGAVIHVFGKTGSRRILLIDSVSCLSTWLSVHPTREIPESPLWVDNIRNGLLHYESIAKIIRVAAKKANISKRVNPHSFRHARATHLAKVFTEAQMKEYFGWVQASNMANVYVHHYISHRLATSCFHTTIFRLFCQTTVRGRSNRAPTLILVRFQKGGTPSNLSPRFFPYLQWT